MRTERQILAEAKAAHNHPTYATMAFVMGCGVQGEGAGSHVLDEHGRRFLALFDQYGNQSFGYSHERIVAAAREQLATGRLNSTKIMFEPEQIRLTERLSRLTGGRLPYSYLANSGGETIDNALKLARAATGRPGFVTAADCFHGKTFAALSASGRAEHAALFSPFLERFRQVPFGDAASLARAVDGDTAAVLLEPVQAEGGVIVPPPGYLAEARRICTEAGALLILDEMQTAFGRCGTFFAFEQSGITPDLVCIGKAFGGGVLAISAVLGTERAWTSLRRLPSTFGSSLGGNPLSCRVGLESIEIASDPAFLRDVGEKARVIDGRLADLAARFGDLISAHRGVGMMHGLEFRDEALAGSALGLLLERGVTSTYSLYNPRVLRVQPPLVISRPDLDQGLDTLEGVLATVSGRREQIALTAAATVAPLVRTVRLDRSAGDVLASLRARPRLLDPFASRPRDRAPAGTDPEFAGTLGHDVVIWADRVEPREDGVALVAEPCWLWRRLERSVTVTPAPDGCTVEIRVDWDTGSGAYEGMLGGHIGGFVARRLTELAASLRPLRLAELAERYAANTTASVVEIDAGGNRRAVTHAELGALARTRADELAAIGVRAGHVIGIRARNGIDWVVWDLAAISLGAVLKAFPDDMPLTDPDDVLKEHELALLVADDAPPGHPSVVAVDGDLTGCQSTGAAPLEAGDLHSLVYSSGTSGTLKGLRISARGSEYVVNRFIDAFDATERDRHLIFLPLANYQQRMSVYCCLWIGADLVLAPYQRVFAALRSERPTFIIAPPVFYDAALQLFGKTGAGVSLGEFLGGGIRFMITGMAPIRRQTLDRFWAEGVHLLEAYGMNECGMVAWNTPDAYRVGTVGRLFDPDAVTFLPDGELHVNRPNPQSLGYFGVADDVAAEVFRADGAIATGDLGHLDADGYLTLVGRKKDVIALGSGRKVHPAEIEAAFAGLDGIAELIIVPTPRYNRLGAIITPDGPGDEAQRTAIRARIEEVNRGLDAHRRVASVVFSERPLHGDPRFMTANMKLSRPLAAGFFARTTAGSAE